MVGWVKVAQREGGSSPTADCACGGLCCLEVNPATEDPPRHHIGSPHPTSGNHPGYPEMSVPQRYRVLIALLTYNMLCIVGLSEQLPRETGNT